MKSILVLMCLCLNDLSGVYGTSKKVLDFLSYYNGDFDNRAQIKQAGDNHAFMQTRLWPVDIQCLLPNTAVFLEEGLNNVIRFFGLGVVTDGIEDTVDVALYNFTDYTGFKPREFKAESLINMSCEDIQGDPDCIASYTVSSGGFAFGNFPYCSVTVNGKHPRFTSLHMCNSSTITMAMYSNQTSTMEPYELQLTSQKYPVINQPQGYVSPCGN